MHNSPQLGEAIPLTVFSLLFTINGPCTHGSGGVVVNVVMFPALSGNESRPTQHSAVSMKHLCFLEILDKKKKKKTE